VTNFLTKKRINTELLIDRTPALYKLDSHIRDEINEGDQPMAIAGRSLSIPSSEKVREREIRRQPVSK